MNVPVKRLNDGSTNYFPMCVLDSVFLNSPIEVKNTIGGITKGSTIQKNTSLQILINKLLAIEGTDVEEQLANKVDKVDGKTLTSNDFTDELKTKVLNAITSHQDISGKVDKVDGKGLSSNDFTDAYKSKVINAITEHQDISGKVDKVEGKTLTSNDFTDVLKAKLVALSPTIAYDDTEIRALLDGKLNTGNIEWTLSSTSIYPVQSKVLYAKIAAMDTKDEELEESIETNQESIKQLNCNTNDITGSETIIHSTDGLTLQTWHNDVKWIQLNSDLSSKCVQNIKKISIQSIVNINDIEETDLTGTYRLLLYANEGDFNPSDTTTKLVAMSTDVIEILGGAGVWNTWTFDSVNLPRSNCKIILLAVSSTNSKETISSWQFSDAVTASVCIGTQCRTLEVSTDDKFLKNNGTIVNSDKASVKITCNDSSYINNEISTLNNSIIVPDTITSTAKDGFYSICQWVQLDKSEFKHTAIKSISIRTGDKVTVSDAVRLVLYRNYADGTPTNYNTQFAACSTNSVTLQKDTYNTWYFDDAYIPDDCHLVCMLIDTTVTSVEDYDWDTIKTKYKRLSVSTQFVSSKDNDIVFTSSAFTSKLVNMKFTYADSVGELERQIATKYNNQFPDYWSDDLTVPGAYFYKVADGIYTLFGTTTGLIGEHCVIISSDGSTGFLYSFNSSADGKVTYTKHAATIDSSTNAISVADIGCTFTQHRNGRFGFTSSDNASLLNGKSDMELVCLFKEDVATSILGYDLYDSSKTYDSGDIVYHNNCIYKCNSDITVAEDWDADHWDAANNQLLKTNTLAETVVTAVENMSSDQIARFKTALGI